MKCLTQLVMLAVLVSACAISEKNTPSSSQLPTLTPRQAFTPRPTLTATITVTLNACVKDSTIRIRQGPGTEYEVIGGLVSGTCITILGRNQDSTWAYIVTGDKITGWVAAWLLTIDGNLDRTSIQKVSGIAENISPTRSVSHNTNAAPTTWINPFAQTNTPRPVLIQPTAKDNNCSPAYPTVCIPPKPPDLDCRDIPYRRFTVLPPDPHGFDGDGDGIGCE